MESKSVKVIAAIVAFLVGGFLARQAIDWIRREPAVSKNVVEKAWVQQTWGASQYSFEAPWRLEAMDLKFPPELTRLIKSSSALGHEADGLLVQAQHILYDPTVQLSLEGAADGALANLKSVPGTKATANEKKQTTVLSLPAYEFSARIERERGFPLQLHGLVFAEGQELYQLQVICRADQEEGSAAWRKILASIK